MTTADSATAMETTARPWGFLLIEGFMLVIIGAILLWAPAKTQVNTFLILVNLLGIYWIVRGVLDLVHMFTDHTGWGWKLIMGLISIIAGTYIVSYPIAAAVVLPQVFVLILGIWAFLQGIVALILAFRGGGWGVGILGVIGIVFGIILMVNYGVPGMGLAMIWAAAVWAFVGGIMLIFQAFRQRSA